jgi:hypothetical protein
VIDLDRSAICHGKLKSIEMGLVGIGPLATRPVEVESGRNSGRFLADEERESTAAARRGQAHFEPGAGTEMKAQARTFFDLLTP